MWRGHKISVPFYEALKANNVVEKSISTIEECEYNIEEIDFLKEIADYDATLEIKKIIDDKAKSVILTVTVSVSISTSLISIFVNDSFSTWVFVTGVALGFLALVSMIVAASLSLNELGENNIISFFPSSRRNENNDENKVLAKKCHLQNVQRNIIRNNLVNAAYNHIIIGLIILSIMFLTISVGVFVTNNMMLSQQNKETVLIKNDIESLKSVVNSVYNKILINEYE